MKVWFFALLTLASCSPSATPQQTRSLAVPYAPPPAVEPPPPEHHAASKPQEKPDDGEAIEQRLDKIIGTLDYLKRYIGPPKK